MRRRLSVSVKKKELITLQKSLEQKRLLLSCENGDIQTLKSILNKYKTKRRRKNNYIKSLIEHEDTSNNNRTPLIYCLSNGNISCLLELLRNNIDLEHCVSGCCPLYHATTRGFIECVEELLIYGANTDTINDKGYTCLMNASYFGNCKIVSLLLKYGANTDIQRDKYDNKCSLHFAVQNNRYNVCKILLKYGANTNIFDNENMTPLMYAVANGYYNIVQLLILYGANVCLKNKNGKSAIDYCNMENNSELFSFIQQSTHIYNAIYNKLITPQTMRKIIKLLSNISFIYPSIIAKLRSVSHMYELTQSQSDIYKFNQKISELNKCLNEISFNNCTNDIFAFLKECKSKLNNCQSNINDTNKKLQHIEIGIDQTIKRENSIKNEIILLQKQLKQCEDKKKELKNKKLSIKHLISNYKIEKIDLENEVKLKNKIFNIADAASINIENLYRKSNDIKLKYTNELQNQYKKKRKILEQTWQLWNINDVITWICSLDSNGKFYKYKHKLKKLKHLNDKKKKKIVTNNNYDNFLMQHYNYDMLFDINQEYIVDGDDECKSDHDHIYNINDNNYVDIEGKNISNHIQDDASSDDSNGDDDIAVANVNDNNNNNCTHDIECMNKIIVDEYQLNEGQYNSESSDNDSKCSNNDNNKYDTSEVIISALLPKNDEDEEEDDEDDVVNQLLNTMDDILNECFSSSLSSSASEMSSSSSSEISPILESINNTVLKMCGIRDCKDRKIIMSRIEILKNDNK